MKLFNTSILMLVMFVGVSCSSLEDVYRDKYVVAETKMRSVLVGNLHGDDSTNLRVFGRLYKNVRGSKPFYIMVPELNSIVFVTQDRKEQRTLHLINLETKKEKSVFLGGLYFGSNIGFEQYGRKQGDAATDYISNVGVKTFQINGVSGNWKDVGLIDIESQSVSRKETIYFDKDGKITKRYINGVLSPWPE